MLCERLRQLDGPDVGKRLQENLLPLDASVWSPSSPVFDPPHLSGRVPERTAAEAMISHSDNTGTDIVMRATGPGKVRQFISEIGLRSTQIPDSTRAFFGYLLGRPDFRSVTWEQIVRALQNNTPFVNPPLNETQTLASSAIDLVDFYSRSLKGEFFTDPATLKEYRRILSYADAVAAAVPVGASGYGKGGSIDVPGFHTMCFAGGMAFSNRWVYFANILNWDAPDSEDAQTAAAWVASTERAINLVFRLCRNGNEAKKNAGPRGRAIPDGAA